MQSFRDSMVCIEGSKKPVKEFSLDVEQSSDFRPKWAALKFFMKSFQKLLRKLSDKKWKNLQVLVQTDSYLDSISSVKCDEKFDLQKFQEEYLRWSKLESDVEWNISSLGNKVVLA